MVGWGADFASKAMLNKRPKWLVFSGGNGCGKTKVARRVGRIIRESAVDLWSRGIWEQPPIVVAVDWPAIVEQELKEYTESAEDISKADVVILDEVGGEMDRYKSGEPTSRLRRLLGAIENKWVLITTNLSPERFADQWDQRVASRLNAAIVFDASNIPDYRSIKGAA